jgi:hypothetical protein
MRDIEEISKRNFEMQGIFDTFAIERNGVEIGKQNGFFSSGSYPNCLELIGKETDVQVGDWLIHEPSGKRVQIDMLQPVSTRSWALHYA